MDSPFACDMNAFSADERDRHSSLAQALWPAIDAFEELPDGYAARFAPNDATVRDLAEFVTLERLCCPWLTLAVELEREHGPLRLRITARDGGKPAIREEFRITGLTEVRPA